jgi:hypothetical protein
LTSSAICHHAGDEQLADATPAQHRHRNLGGIGLIAPGFDKVLQFLWLHQIHYRLDFRDP